MKIVDRYLLREYLVNLAYCVALFAMILVIYDLFNNLGKFMEAETPFFLIAYYYACSMIPMVEYLLPASLLLATLYTLWYLTRNNEFTAMRASGLSLLRIMTPFLMVGVLCTALSSGIKEFFSPHAGLWTEHFSRSKFRNADMSIYEDVAYYNRITRRQWKVGKMDTTQPDRLHDVKVKQERPDGSRIEEITARRAEWREESWWFYGVQVQRYDSFDVPLKKPKPADAEISVLEMAHYTERPADFMAEVKPQEFLSSLELARFISSHRDLSREARRDYRFNLHSRLAMPWACLIVTLFGIPAGTRGGRHNILTGIFLALAFFFGFYALMHVGIFMGKRGIVATWIGAWLPNLVCLTAGLTMMHRLK